VVEVVEAKTASQISWAIELIKAYATSLEIDLSFQNFDREMAEFPGAYTRPDGRLFLAIEGGEAVGVVALRKLSGKTCEMKRLYVRPDFRGKGVGRMLVRKVLGEAQEIGYTRMRLDTLSSMIEAISLYESLGFEKIPPYRFNPHRSAVYMERILKVK
jgi:ribosomal protein S18 acetylase RimI-like enzyme